MLALSGIWADEVEACDENDIYKYMDVSYKDTCDRCDEILKKEEQQRKIVADLENEKKQREATEEMLLSLLEETCNKLDIAAQH